MIPIQVLLGDDSLERALRQFEFTEKIWLLINFIPITIYNPISVQFISGIFQRNHSSKCHFVVSSKLQIWLIEDVISD